VPLRLEADLILEVEGSTLQLRGSGQHFQLEVSELRPLMGLGVSRRMLSRLAEQLARQGLTLDVVDTSEPLLSLGKGISSRSGSLLFASSRVALRRPMILLWRLLRPSRGG
jgi:hypothetical protein